MGFLSAEEHWNLGSKGFLELNIQYVFMIILLSSGAGEASKAASYVCFFYFHLPSVC